MQAASKAAGRKAKEGFIQEEFPLIEDGQLKLFDQQVLSLCRLYSIKDLPMLRTYASKSIVRT